MKQTITIIILVLTFGLQSAMAQKKEITETFSNYIEATKSDNLEEQLKFFHPQLFIFFPKDTFLLALEMIKANPMVKVGNERLISISEVYIENGSQYALLTFNQEMSMNMSNMKNQGGSDYAISLMIDDFKRQYGEENVNFDEKLYKVEIMMTNEFYAIFDPKLKTWKFLPKDEDSKSIIEQIVPEKIRQKI